MNALPLTGSPVFSIIPEDKTILEGDVVTYSCSALGDPFPAVTWTFNDTMLSNGDKYQVETSGPDIGQLRIMNTTFSDRGEYMCTYSNTVGSASTSVILTVQGTE